jgi:hypothetical protein
MQLIRYSDQAGSKTPPTLQKQSNQRSHLLKYFNIVIFLSIQMIQQCRDPDNWCNLFGREIFVTTKKMVEIFLVDCRFYIMAFILYHYLLTVFNRSIWLNQSCALLDTCFSIAHPRIRAMIQLEFKVNITENLSDKEGNWPFIIQNMYIFAGFGVYYLNLMSNYELSKIYCNSFSEEPIFIKVPYVVCTATRRSLSSCDFKTSIK